uniref:Uncharacterized protein n=1 Tax=Heterorhabditis bacteriophora TaxID=37862 RepID=A0A1I7WAA9_HETBA
MILIIKSTGLDFAITRVFVVIRDTLMCVFFHTERTILKVNRKFYYHQMTTNSTKLIIILSNCSSSDWNQESLKNVYFNNNSKMKKLLSYVLYNTISFSKMISFRLLPVISLYFLDSYFFCY